MREPTIKHLPRAWFRNIHWIPFRPVCDQSPQRKNEKQSTRSVYAAEVSKQASGKEGRKEVPIDQQAA